MDRRTFLRSSSTLFGMGLISSQAVLESCKKNNSLVKQANQGSKVNFTLDLSQPANSTLNNTGGFVSSNGVVVANHNGSYIAVAQSCTHQGCSVSYNANGNNFICPCHNGVYDSNGKVVSGPPPTDLKKYTVTKSGNILTIKG